MPNVPKHDDLIVELIKERARLKVVRNLSQPTFHRDATLWLPTTQIYVFRERPGRYQPACFQPDPHNYPRLRLKVKVITWHEFWFSAHRISAVEDIGATELEIDHIDRDRWNYNNWNLRPATYAENHSNKGQIGFCDFLEMFPDYHGYLQRLEDQVRQEFDRKGLLFPAYPPGASAFGSDDDIF